MKLFGAVVTALLTTACGARSSLGVEAGSGPDVSTPDAGAPPTGCEGGPNVPIYTVAIDSNGDNVLYRFDPPSKAFTHVGTLKCAATQDIFGQTQVFSMAVARSGTAYVLYNTGQLFAVDTSTAKCATTPFVYDAGKFTPTFGMGFSADSGGATESLYLASFASPAPPELARLDTSTFDLAVIGNFSKNLGDSELTGTADGRLYALAFNNATETSVLDLEKSDARVLSVKSLEVPFPQSFAVAYWRGDLYFFLAPTFATGGNGTTVERYHIADGTHEATYAHLANAAVYGAGVSTCAPL